MQKLHYKRVKKFWNAIPQLVTETTYWRILHVTGSSTLKTQEQGKISVLAYLFVYNCLQEQVNIFHFYMSYGRLLQVCTKADVCNSKPALWSYCAPFIPEHLSVQSKSLLCSQLHTSGVHFLPWRPRTEIKTRYEKYSVIRVRELEVNNMTAPYARAQQQKKVQIHSAFSGGKNKPNQLLSLIFPTTLQIHRTVLHLKKKKKSEK